MVVAKGTRVYQDCEARIQSWFMLCRSHNEDKISARLTNAPTAGCTRMRAIRCVATATLPAGSTHSGKYEPERNPRWEQADAEGDVFFICILKLDGGNFYAGHTRELRERMSEHRDGKTVGTADRNPRLVYFDRVYTREEAADGEAYFKELIDKNEREVRRIVREFQDLIREVYREDTETTQTSDSVNAGGYRPPRYGYRRQTAR